MGDWDNPDDWEATPEDYMPLSQAFAQFVEVNDIQFLQADPAPKPAGEQFDEEYDKLIEPLRDALEQGDLIVACQLPSEKIRDIPSKAWLKGKPMTGHIDGSDFSPFAVGKNKELLGRTPLVKRNNFHSWLKGFKNTPQNREAGQGQLSKPRKAGRPINSGGYPDDYPIAEMAASLIMNSDVKLSYAKASRDASDSLGISAAYLDTKAYDRLRSKIKRLLKTKRTRK